MEDKKRKIFKRRFIYIQLLLLRVFVFLLSIWFFFQICRYNEQELIEMFGEQELIGSSNQRGAQAIQMLIINTWGKTGIIVCALLFISGALHYLIKEMKEFKRFLRKDKLYNQGLVFDLYDDYQPVPMLKWIKNLFLEKSKGRKRSYRSEKEMQEGLMNNKYYKKD